MNKIIKALFCYSVALFSLSACAQTAEPEEGVRVASWNRYQELSEHEGSLQERGQAIFVNWCSACHSKDLRDAPGTTSLQFKYDGQLPGSLEERTDLTQAYIEYVVRNGIAMMPFFRPTELSDEDIEVLSAYLVKE